MKVLDFTRDLFDRKPVYSPADIMPVEQGAFGYLSPEVEKDLGYSKMETAGLGPCVALLLIDKENKFYVMAHVDGLRQHFLNQIVQEIRRRFPSALIVYSQQYDEGILESVRKFAYSHADEVKELFQQEWSGSIGIDIEGRVYKPEGIHAGLVPQNKLEQMELMFRQNFKNMNRDLKRKKLVKEVSAYDREGLPPELVDGDVVPGVGARYHSVTDLGYCAYGVRVPTNLSEDEIKEVISGLHLPDGVKVKHDPKGFIEVYAEGYRIEKDREMVENVNKMVIKLHERMRKF